MRLVTVGNLICAALCASTIICSNILKRPSSSSHPNCWKKRLLSNYSRESTSHPDESLPSAVPVHSLLPKKSVADFSVAAVLNFLTNENGTNSINSTASPIYELISDAEPEESVISLKDSTSFRKNSSQPRTSKSCLNDGINSSLSIQAKLSLSYQTASIDKKLPSRENSKETSDSLIQKNSSITDGEQLVKAKLNQFNKIHFFLDFPYGTLSWSIVDVKSKAFTTSFRFCGENSCCLNFGSDNLINLFFFKYATNTFNLLTKNEKDTSEEYTLKAIKSIYAIFPTIFSLHSHLIPHYYSFSNGNNCKDRRLMDFTKIPSYFLFTSISYLMKNEQDENIQYLGPLLKHAYQRIIDCNKLNTPNWIFLKDFLSQYFDTSDLNFKTNNYAKYSQFDIFIISFIYHEMRFSSNESVKSFFRQVWEKSKQERNRMGNSVQISQSPKISIPFNADNCPNIFERDARKLYQIEFTNLLFKKWNRMEDLLEEFFQLKFNFSTIITDFRLKIFNSNDFESLSNALKHIYSLFERCSLEQKLLARSFLVELEYFINFKCFIFIFDFCNELEKKTINGSLYQKTFESIESILKSFESIRSIGSNYFQLCPINLDILKANRNIQSLSLATLIGKCLLFIESIDFGLFNESKDEFNEFLIHLNNYDYFEKNFNIYLPKNLSRFKWAEFIVELNEILKNNDEEEIALVFSDKKYETGRKMWRLFPKEFSNKSYMGDKKLFLEQFKSFLFLYNQ